MKIGICMYTWLAATRWQEEISKHRQRPGSSQLCRGRPWGPLFRLEENNLPMSGELTLLGKLVWTEIIFFSLEFPVKQWEVLSKTRRGCEVWWWRYPVERHVCFCSSSLAPPLFLPVQNRGSDCDLLDCDKAGKEYNVQSALRATEERCFSRKIGISPPCVSDPPGAFWVHIMCPGTGWL